MTLDLGMLMTTSSNVAWDFRLELACICTFVLGWLISRPASQRQKAHKAERQLRLKQQQSQSGRSWQGRSAPAGSDAALIAEVGPNSPKLLDPAWVVPAIAQLSKSQVMQAYKVYQNALRAGLDLRALSEDQRKAIWMSLVASMIRVGQGDAVVQLVQALSREGMTVGVEVFGSCARLCSSKHLFEECITIYDVSRKCQAFPTITDASVWSCLLLCAVETKAYDRCKVFFNSLKANGTPSQKDFWNICRAGANLGDCESLYELMDEMAAMDIEIPGIVYNTVLSTLITQSKIDAGFALIERMNAVGGVADAITYNSMIKAYAKAGRLDSCFECFELMQKTNIEPTPVTYGILLDACVNEKQVDRASEVFDRMTTSGCVMNTVLYTTLIKGFCRVGKVEEAMHVYGHMLDKKVMPDLITFSLLIKAHCDAADLEAALHLLDCLVKLGLFPDEVVFNNLLVGCSKQGNSPLAKKMYADMVASGVKPSNATFSILIRLYAECGCFEDAVAVLQTESVLHGVELEARLFVQLIQCCIRARQGRRASEVYEMLLKHSRPSLATHSSMLTLCVKLNMFDTAASIFALAAENKCRIDSKDANAVLEGALRKHKPQIIESVIACMDKLGIYVDPKFKSHQAAKQS